jgi:hypothetical protein
MVSLRDLSALEHSLDLHDRILIVSFRGEYRWGSQGNPDAQYMRAVIAGALVAWHCNGVVLDLRELTYQWGNSLLHVFEQRPSLSWSVVVSERCAAARTLMNGALLFESLEPALASLKIATAQARAREDRLEDAPLVVAVEAHREDACQRALECGVRAALAIEEDRRVYPWSGGRLRVRLDRVAKLPEADRVAAVEGAIAYFEE